MHLVHVFLAPYRRNPKAATIEVSIILGLNAVMLAINVFLIGLPLDDMLVIKVVNVLAKGPIAPQYYALRDELYAKQIRSRLVRILLDMLAWGIFQTTLYGGITTLFMGIAWLVGSTHFQFPADKLAQSVGLIWVTATFLAGPITNFRDDIKARLAPDRVVQDRDTQSRTRR